MMFIKNFQRIVSKTTESVFKPNLTTLCLHCGFGGDLNVGSRFGGPPSISGPVLEVINLKACHLLCVNAYFRTTLSGNGLQFGSFDHQGRRRRQQQQQLRSQEPFSQNLRAKTSQVFLRTKVRFLFYCLRLYYDSIFFSKHWPQIEFFCVSFFLNYAKNVQQLSNLVKLEIPKWIKSFLCYFFLLFLTLSV